MEEPEFDIFRRKTTGISLTPEHQKYIKEQDISLTEFTRKKLEEDMKKDTGDKKRVKFQYYSQQIMILVIGFFFVYVAMTSSSFMGWVITFGIGVGLFAYGLFNLAMEVKNAR